MVNPHPGPPPDPGGSLAAAGNRLTLEGLAVLGLALLSIAAMAFAPVFVLAGAFWAVRAMRFRRRRSAAERLDHALARMTGAAGEADRAEVLLDSALARPDLHPEDRQLLARAAYRDSAVDMIRSGNVEPEGLAGLQRILGLEAATAAAAHLDAYRQVLAEAVADHILTAGEEAALEEARIRLGIPAAEIAQELALLGRFGRLRAARAGQLAPVPAPVPLQRDEVCYYTAPGRILKERNLRSFQQGGMRYAVRGLIVDREGTLLVTNRRVLLVHGGTTAVRLGTILQIEADPQQNVLSLTRDSVAAPLLLTTPDAMLAGAVLSALVERAGKGPAAVNATELLNDAG
jgi:hypothetical protein